MTRFESFTSPVSMLEFQLELFFFFFFNIKLTLLKCKFNVYLIEDSFLAFKRV